MGKQETKIIKMLQKEAQSYLNAVHEPANHLNMFTAPEGNIPLDFSEEDKNKDLSYSLTYPENFPQDKKISKEANAIVLGAMLDKKLLEGRKTSSTSVFNPLEFNQDFMIENVIAHGEAEKDRILEFRPAVAQARENAKEAIQNYIQNDDTKAKEMLHNMIATVFKILPLKFGNQDISSRIWNSVTKLAVDVLDMPPLSADGDLTKIQKIHLKSYVKANELVEESMKARLDLAEEFPKPDSPEREKLLEILLVANVITGQMNLEQENAKEQYEAEIANIITEQTKLDGDTEILDFLSNKRKVEDLASPLMNTHISSSATKLQVMLSTKEGASEAYHEYLKKIKDTEEYQKLLKAEGKEFNRLLKTSQKNLIENLKVDFPKAEAATEEEKRHAKEQMDSVRQDALEKTIKTVKETYKQKNYWRDNIQLFASMTKKLKKVDFLLKKSSQEYNDMQKQLKELEELTKENSAYSNGLSVISDDKEPYQQKMQETIRAVKAYLKHKNYPERAPKNDYERKRIEAAAEIQKGLEERLKMFEKQQGLQNADEREKAAAQAKALQEKAAAQKKAELEKTAQKNAEKRMQIQKFVAKGLEWHNSIYNEGKENYQKTQAKSELEKVLASAIVIGSLTDYAAACFQKNKYDQKMFGITQEQFLQKVTDLQNSEPFKNYCKNKSGELLHQILTSQKQLDSFYKDYKSHTNTVQKQKEPEEIKKDLEKEGVNMQLPG